MRISIRRLHVKPEYLTFYKLPTTQTPTKNPVVLCHGLSGFDSLIFLPRPQFWRKRTMKKVIKDGLIKLDYWYGIHEYLQAMGCDVHISKVPSFGSISERAHDLHTYLDNQFNQSQRVKLNLIAHSMGGLDSRYLISKFTSKNYEVASLTTVSTPHHGSGVADFVMRNIYVPPIISKAIPQLTTSSMEQFNNEVQDDPRVQYFSYGARFDPRWFNVFYYPHKILCKEIQHKNRLNNTNLATDNDGLVSVESAKWGEYLGTLDGVDHLDLINWTNRLRTLIDKLTTQKPQFNALAFYSHLIQNLSNRGF